MLSLYTCISQLYSTGRVTIFPLFFSLRNIIIFSFPPLPPLSVSIVMCVRSRPAYFAERAYQSMKGAGTDDATLVRVVVSRSEVTHYKKCLLL